MLQPATLGPLITDNNTVTIVCALDESDIFDRQVPAIAALPTP
jgi:hypothetical protein